MARRTNFVIAILPLLGAACEVVSVRANLDHCTYNDGDRYCADLDPGRPFCTQGDDECKLGGFTGCVADVTPQCHAPCGATPADQCMVGDSSGTDTDTGSESDSGTDSGSSSTGPMPCVGNDDCPDTAAPFCEPVSGDCVACDGMDDPDGSCATVDPAAPLCVGGACVECTAEDPAVCDDQLLLCDDETNACAPCTEHAQCGSGACELDVGRCFPEDFVATVDGDGEADYMTVTAAVDAVMDRSYGVLVVHELDGGAPYTTPGGLLVDGGKTIALLAAPDEAPIIQGTGGNPGLRVEAAGTILYMDGLRVRNGDAEGLVADGAFAWADRSRIVQNSGGGVLAQGGAVLTLRNCFVGGSVDDADALAVDGATANVVYTTLGAGTFNARALVCTAPRGVVVRNSILVSRGGTPPDEIACSMASINNSATEGVVRGTANMDVGGFPGASPQDWFVDYAGGDLSLQNDGLTAFAGIAQWQDGDPVTDIHGDPRLTDALGYAGADSP